MPTLSTISSTCLHCGATLRGRIDKKSCDAGCKGEYNNRLQRQERTEINQIDLILKRNRRILKRSLGSGSSRLVPTRELLQQGLRFEYYTHHYENRKGDRYSFCYDFGYLEVGQGMCLVVRRQRAL